MRAYRLLASAAHVPSHHAQRTRQPTRAVEGFMSPSDTPTLTVMQLIGFTCSLLPYRLPFAFAFAFFIASALSSPSLLPTAPCTSSSPSCLASLSVVLIHDYFFPHTSLSWAAPALITFVRIPRSSFPIISALPHPSSRFLSPSFLRLLPVFISTSFSPCRPSMPSPSPHHIRSVLHTLHPFRFNPPSLHRVRLVSTHRRYIIHSTSSFPPSY
ncbi:hypothetical protein C8J57DRAFT_1638001 [Mycena rebaudengoi]|nr:hypothetical protein C8J57DRAFT_1638001 [Mycena rebaudengoi]